MESVDVAGKRVLIRVDFNVPIENGVVADATRLERVLPTIRDLVGRGAKVVVLSHLGRPKGVPTPDTSLLPVAAKMRELMPGTAISFVGDCVGDEVDAAVAALKPGEVVVLENVRYHKGEEKNEPPSPRGSRRTPTSMSATPSPPRTGRMPRLRRSPTCCRLMPGSR